jgi:mono/diheme cytochrome c family protein
LQEIVSVRREPQRRVLLVLSITFAALTSATASERRIPKRRASAVNPRPAASTSLETGAEIYAAECGSCHGDGPETTELEEEVPDLTLPHAYEQSDGVIFRKITVDRSPMPGYRKQL